MKPLTIEELKSLKVGDWVWIKFEIDNPIDRRYAKQERYFQIIEPKNDTTIRFNNYAPMEYADYGKTWFTFGYELVFVPADQSEDGWVWAGNTDYYQGDGAPEGALTWNHVGYMYLIDGNWVCENTGTGW